jgi:hypothetical protein
MELDRELLAGGFPGLPEHALGLTEGQGVRTRFELRNDPDHEDRAHHLLSGEEPEVTDALLRVAGVDQLEDTADLRGIREGREELLLLLRAPSPAGGAVGRFRGILEVDGDGRIGRKRGPRLSARAELLVRDRSRLFL